MVRVVFVCIFTLLLSCMGIESGNAQLFPYTVPKAPEFDGNGNYRNRPAEGPPPADRSDSTRPQVQDRRSQYAAVGPPAPHVPVAAPQAQAPVPRAPRQVPAVHSPRPQSISHEPEPVESPAGQQAPAQGPPDCTPYPMAIAQARSQEQMQAIAREYLTCLLQNGWPSEQARKHVITTIESTYALTR